MKKYWYYFISIFELIFGIVEWPMVVRVFLGLGPEGEKKVHLRRTGLAYITRSAMDLWSLKEAQIDRFYDAFGTPVEKGWVVIDIGGGIGEFTLHAARQQGSRVFAYEPFFDSYELLLKNIHLNGCENITARQEAVWSETGVLVLEMSGGEPLQFRSMEAASAASIQCEHCLVNCYSLADVFVREGIEQVDLLKMDCEGAEYRILFNAPQAALIRVRRIIMEYHDEVTPYSHGDLTQYLQGQGFSVRSIQNAVHANLGYLYAWRTV